LQRSPTRNKLYEISRKSHFKNENILRLQFLIKYKNMGLWVLLKNSVLKRTGRSSVALRRSKNDEFVSTLIIAFLKRLIVTHIKLGNNNALGLEPSHAYWEGEAGSLRLAKVMRVRSVIGCCNYQINCFVIFQHLYQ